MKAKASDVVDIFKTLSRYSQTDPDDDFQKIVQFRMITSLCTLLKGRSIRVLGVQLLLTFMLIARATNEQVN